MSAAPAFLAYGHHGTVAHTATAAAGYAAIREEARIDGVNPAAFQIAIVAPGIVRITAGARIWVLRRLPPPQPQGITQ